MQLSVTLLLAAAVIAVSGTPVPADSTLHSQSEKPFPPVDQKFADIAQIVGKGFEIAGFEAT